MGPTSLPVSAAELNSWLLERQGAWESLLSQLVDLESPSGDGEGIRSCGEAVAQRALERVRGSEVRWGGTESAPWLRLGCGGAGPSPVLLLGHLDTVWERGAFGGGFESDGGRATGPGVFDMKGGVVVGLAALEALSALGGARPPLVLLLTGDEEVGSPSSRGPIEYEAGSSRAVLVLEPPSGAALKLARKGVGTFRLSLRGRAAHAGLEPDRGVNAVSELARLVAEVEALADPDAGTTVTPTVLRGGGHTNVVPDSAELLIDVRFPSAGEAARVESGLRGLRPRHPEATLEVGGGSNRPPLEPAASEKLFSLARASALELGWPGLAGTRVGGGSDGNFTAALGIPTLDGLGIIGGGAHARGEWADLGSIPERAALLAACLWGLTGADG